MKNFREITIKAPLELRKRLVKIIRNLPSSIKFHDVAAFILKRYKFKLELFQTLKDNEVILDTKNLKHFESSPQQPSNDELSEYIECLKRIDFTDDLTDDLQPPQIDILKEYVEIKVRIMVRSMVNGVEKIESIDNFFDRVQWKVNDVYKVHIAHIYDPSKVWIRFGSIDVLQKHFYEFYDEKRDTMKLKLDDIHNGLDCIASISNLYYRGRIVRSDIQDPNYFRVFLYDFGMVTRVDTCQLYRLDESLKKFPAAAVRATLSNISSIDNQMWGDDSVQRLVELTEDRSLIAQITRVNTKRKILEINLFDKHIEKKGKIFSINYRMVHEGLAKVAWDEEIEPDLNHCKCKQIRNYLYLFPTFEMIEQGITPSRVGLIEELKKCVAWDALFPDFYKYDNAD